jgi:RND family efflux transporter MFP subunit
MRTIEVFCCVAAATTLAACAKVEGNEPQAAVPVRTETVAKAPPAPAVRYSATIEAYEQVSLAFKTSGYVDYLLARRGADGRMRDLQPGDAVAGGTLLARIRETDAIERVAQGTSRLAEAEASITKARLDVERARTLFAQDSLTKPELDAAEAAFDAADARGRSARADLALAESGLRDCRLAAPANGVVLSRSIEVGTLVSPGASVLSIGDVSAVKARFGIPDAMLPVIALGDTIGVTVDAVGATAFTGRLTAMAPAADPQSRVFQVEVTIPNPDGRLRPGMIGTVAIASRGAVADAADRPLVVPLAAVVRSRQDAGRFAVFVVDRTQGVEVARAKQVELGEVLGNGIAVTGGLQAGDAIVTSGAALLVDGQAVRRLAGAE